MEEAASSSRSISTNEGNSAERIGVRKEQPQKSGRKGKELHTGITTLTLRELLVVLKENHGQDT